MLGETLLKIRKNRNLTQKEVAKDILQQATYSRIERGQLEINAETLNKLVERLNLTMNEFFYIHQNYIATPKSKLIQNFAQMELVLENEIDNQLSAITQYLKLHDDEDILMLHYAYLAMKELVTTQNIEEVRAYASQVWTRMQNLEHWYINDLDLLNAIILYFPLDVAKEITQTAIRRLDAYDHYERDMTYLKIYFLLNLTSLYLEDGAFSECLNLLEMIHEKYQKKLTYQTLGFILCRKMTCKHHLKENYSTEKHHFEMLQQLFNDEEVFNFLKQELSLNEVAFK